jgi:transposase InsO family protein
MKWKSDTFACFKSFCALFEKEGCHSIRALRSDNGGEYMSKEFENYLTLSGIKHKTGPPHSPELNRVSERANRSISNTFQAALLAAHLPKTFWVDALWHSFYAHNSFPCNTPLGFKPPAAILGHKPVDLSYLHPFGCLTYYRVPKASQSKLNQKGYAAILLLYLSKGNGY